MEAIISHPFSPLAIIPAFAIVSVVVGLAVGSRRLPDMERRVWRRRLFSVTLAFWLAGVHAAAWLIVVAQAGSPIEADALGAGTHLAFWYTVAAAVAVVATDVATRTTRSAISTRQEVDTRETYGPNRIFEPSLRGRIAMVGVAIGCFLTGFIPEPWHFFSGWSFGAAFFITLMIFANYIFDGKPGTLNQLHKDPQSKSTFEQDEV